MVSSVKKRGVVTGIAAVICAGIFFAAAAMAGDPGFSGPAPGTPSGPVLLASTSGNGPRTPAAEFQELKKEMDHVFEVLGGILADDSLTLEQKQQKALAFLKSYRYGPNGTSYF